MKGFVVVGEGHEPRSLETTQMHTDMVVGRDTQDRRK